MFITYLKRFFCKFIITLFIVSLLWLIPNFASGCIPLIAALPIAAAELVILDSACTILLYESENEEPEINEKQDNAKHIDYPTHIYHWHSVA